MTMLRLAHNQLVGSGSLSPRSLTRQELCSSFEARSVAKPAARGGDAPRPPAPQMLWPSIALPRGRLLAASREAHECREARA